VKAVVNGWLEVEPLEGSTVRVLHLVNNQGKRTCRCRYGKDTAASAKPRTHRVDEQELSRDDAGNLRIDQAGDILFPIVALCEKSEKALREELTKWQKWEGE
jgi:hypothetical protein